MNFLKTVKAAVSIATSQTYDIDWARPEVREAAVIHWKEVKAAADPALCLASMRLTEAQNARLEALLEHKGYFPETPTDELLDGLPEAIPEASLNRIVGSIINDCLTNHKHGAVVPAAV
ncbi:hypothetical protein FBU31_004508 [Coemansia sp. 'formosensis']|nr:hypothetical protein FBU31_004508 [Coemansia sp. 'formosensis']